MRLILAAACLAALPVQAQQRAEDEPFSQEGLADALSGQVLQFFDDSTSTFRADATYAYRYTADGDDWTGQWRTNDASQVCVDFDNGSARCDTIVRAGDRLVMIIENGDRFPVKALIPVN